MMAGGLKQRFRLHVRHKRDNLSQIRLIGEPHE
jgi:hypothetical protein